MIENMMWKESFVLSFGSAGMKKAKPVLLSLWDHHDTDSYHMSFNAVTYQTSTSHHVSCSHTICQLLYLEDSDRKPKYIRLVM